MGRDPFAQGGVDAGLIAVAGAGEVVENIGVNPQRDLALHGPPEPGAFGLGPVCGLGNVRGVRGRGFLRQTPRLGQKMRWQEGVRRLVHRPSFQQRWRGGRK